MKTEKLQRSLKRKRSDSENMLGEESKHHGLKEVRKAAKRVKVFETQKLVKKLKGLRKSDENSSDVAEHEAQLSIIKTIEHEVIANTAVKTKILKDGILSQHDRVQEALSLEIGDSLLPTATQNTPTAKVHSRLLSSKTLAMEIASLCDDLRKLLGREPKKARAEADGDDDFDSHEATRNLISRTAISPEPLSHAELEGVNETGWESGTVEKEEHIADGWESGSISPDDRELDAQQDEDGGKRANVRRNTSTKSTQTGVKQPSTTSTFLPSLSVGFIRGSDESDWSDNEAKLADSGQKKNRRGQRARRAIWEKKYGRNANHKKQELEAQSNRLHHDNKHGREHGHRGSLSKFGKQSNMSDRSKQYKPFKQDPAPPKIPHQRNITKSDERPLHPSWEAKRKLKEKQSTGIIPSQGTKIKFSD
ncbi:Bud-site selection protein [Macrolepiota fuliginosa MF-IS2]|uniref:Bud-site selection protein n=1 Tax=Macrolepiota fuliginosa MF-IS2 TaxID=1400762 RepID=A0A9P6CA75_9AGAR|nr:Bud-site selection protein [Macrolepiota fuliginosa MF-IS2]